MPKFHTCTTCKKYRMCRSLCPKAKKYADQDHVKGREFTIGIPIVTERITEIGPAREAILTDREFQILTLVALNGFSREATARALHISRGALRVHLFEIRKKIPQWKGFADENFSGCQRSQTKEE